MFRYIFAFLKFAVFQGCAKIQKNHNFAPFSVPRFFQTQHNYNFDINMLHGPIIGLCKSTFKVVDIFSIFDRDHYENCQNGRHTKLHLPISWSLRLVFELFW